MLAAAWRRPAKSTESAPIRVILSLAAWHFNRDKYLFRKFATHRHAGVPSRMARAIEREACKRCGKAARPISAGVREAYEPKMKLKAPNHQNA